MAFVESHNAKIYYEAHGAGPALVFAHGAGGNAASWWQQLPHYVERYRVIAFDHRMFGRSECAPEDFQAEFFADDVRAILWAEGIERAALVCQSMGGWSGSRLAVESPELVSVLVMSHTPGCFSTAEITRQRNAAMARVNRDELPPGRFAHWAVAPDFHETNPQAAYLYTQISGLNARFDRQLLSRLAVPNVMIDIADVPLVDEVFAVPTLFITALQDQIFPPSLIELVAKALPGAEYEVLGDAGHSSYFEAPERFNASLTGFLDRYWPGS